MAVAIGDDPKDIMAAKAARVYAIGVLWGASNHQALVSSRPDLICETVGELREALLDWFL
jgi:phosphoglycolate phosphatase-like HAD superfamily hydrolase